MGGQLFEKRMEGMRIDERTETADEVFDVTPERANRGFGDG